MSGAEAEGSLLRSLHLLSSQRYLRNLLDEVSRRPLQYSEAEPAGSSNAAAMRPSASAPSLRSVAKRAPRAPDEHARRDRRPPPCPPVACGEAACMRSARHQPHLEDRNPNTGGDVAYELGGEGGGHKFQGRTREAAPQTAPALRIRPRSSSSLLRQPADSEAAAGLDAGVAATLASLRDDPLFSAWRDSALNALARLMRPRLLQR